MVIERCGAVRTCSTLHRIQYFVFYLPFLFSSSSSFPLFFLSFLLLFFFFFSSFAPTNTKNFPFFPILRSKYWVMTLSCFEESLRSISRNPVVRSINFAKYSTFFLRSKSSKQPRPSSLQHCLHSNKVTPPQQTWVDTFLLQKRFPCFWYLTGSVQQRRDTHLLP